RENGIERVSNGGEPSSAIRDMAASFQASVVKALVGTLSKLAAKLRPKTLIVAGGVACNQALRQAAEIAAKRLELPVYFTSESLSTDNAAMIAAAGNFHLRKCETAGLQMTADITMRLQTIGDQDADLRNRKVRYRL